MRVANGLEELDTGRDPVVASIGNYDGVHRGHQAILAAVVDDARRRGVEAMLITFEPHPATVVAPERRPDPVQTRGQKLRALERTGIDEVLILRFDTALAALDGVAFFDEYLLPRLPLAAVHVGRNFRFGRGRQGDLELLRSIGERAGFEVNGVPQVRFEDAVVSSSAIRAAIRGGDVALARQLLGHPFALSGLVARGASRGRGMGFPTANLEPDSSFVPRNGVYISQVRALAGLHPAMTNVGSRPTFGETKLAIETHLLDFDEDLYGQRIEIQFLERLRDEKAFDGPTELADQLARDRATVEAYFAQMRLPAE